MQRYKETKSNITFCIKTKHLKKLRPSRQKKSINHSFGVTICVE